MTPPRCACLARYGPRARVTRAPACEPRGGWHPPEAEADHLVNDPSNRLNGSMAADPEAADRAITVFLADDNTITREGVRALLALESDLEIVGTAGDYD